MATCASLTTMENLIIDGVSYSIIDAEIIFGKSKIKELTKSEKTQLKTESENIKNIDLPEVKDKPIFSAKKHQKQNKSRHKNKYSKTKN